MKKTLKKIGIGVAIIFALMLAFGIYVNATMTPEDKEARQQERIEKSKQREAEKLKESEQKEAERKKEEQDFIDTGIFGIQMPKNAENVQQSSNIWIGEYPKMEFAEIAEWVGPRLPNEIEDMPLVHAGRTGKGKDTGHEWCYEKQDGDSYKMVYVLVGANKHVYVQSAMDDSAGCQTN